MSTINSESSSVQSSLSILQGVINRMASSSASAKAWCITLVSAILVLVVDKGKSQYSLVAIIPTALFFALDSYYLALEKMFRESYSLFIEKLHNGTIVATDLYVASPSGSLIKNFLISMCSFSIWPFYLMLLITIFLVKQVVM